MIRIGIAGVGGIGSNVAALLARAGAETLRIVDFDRVELGNLNRQYYFPDQVGGLKTRMLKNNLLRINPKLTVECVEEKIDRSCAVSQFDDCECVVEGMDTLSDKQMFVETMAESGRHVVSASGIAGENLSGIRIRKIGNCHIVGDFESDAADCRISSQKVLMVSLLMADIIIRTYSLDSPEET